MKKSIATFAASIVVAAAVAGIATASPAKQAGMNDKNIVQTAVAAGQFTHHRTGLGTMARQMVAQMFQRLQGVGKAQAVQAGPASIWRQFHSTSISCNAQDRSL